MKESVPIIIDTKWHVPKIKNLVTIPLNKIIFDSSSFFTVSFKHVLQTLNTWNYKRYVGEAVQRTIRTTLAALTLPVRLLSVTLSLVSHHANNKILEWQPKSY